MAVQAKWRDGVELELADPRQDGAKQSFSFETTTGTGLTATLVADPESASLGRLQIRAGEVLVEVIREAGSSRLLRRIEAPGHVAESPGPVDPDDSAGLVGEQLSRGGKNSLFQKIIPRFLKLMSV